MNNTELEAQLEAEVRRRVRGRNGVKLPWNVSVDSEVILGEQYARIEIPGELRWGGLFHAGDSVGDIASWLATKYREHLNWYVGDMCSWVLYQITGARCVRVNLKQYTRAIPWEDIVAIEALKDDNSEAEYAACRELAEELNYTGVVGALDRAHTTIAEREDR